MAMNSRLKHDQDKINSYSHLLGLDEVGWGCIAGDLVLGACIVHSSFFNEVDKLDQKIVDMVRDSKKLSEVKRESITSYFLSQKELSEDKIKLIIGRASVEEINSVGLAKAFDLCVERILSQTPADTLILLDGKRVPSSLQSEDVELIIKGDDTAWVIGLASIFAKTFRDKLMDDLHSQYPQYGLTDHKGYGTANHVQALKLHGITPIHRTKSTNTILS